MVGLSDKRRHCQSSRGHKISLALEHLHPYNRAMFRKTNQSGMTIKELVVVLAIISGMVLASVPAFFYLQKLARTREYNKLVDLVQTGIVSWNVKRQILQDQKPYPPFLDHDPEGTTCTKCFDLVIEKEVNDPFWLKESQNVYLYSIQGKTGDAASYVKPGNRRLIYLPESGKLVSEIL